MLDSFPFDFRQGYYVVDSNLERMEKVLDHHFLYLDFMCLDLQVFFKLYLV